MLKIKIYSVGKTKEHWLQEALDEYAQRLKPILSLEWILAKNDLQLKQLLAKESDFICLDPLGKQSSSEEFSTLLMSLFQKYDSRLCFVIGGAEGIAPEIKAKSVHMISFSRMTFTHQMTRLVLVEQIYRAIEIWKNSPYHK